MARGGAQPRTREAGSLGSGFIISPDGYVVTNNHLIQGLTGTGTVDSVTITTTNGKEYSARIVGRDDTSDLALLKIDGHNLPFVQWGDSTKARVGDWVIAIGNPYGLGGTVTAGIVSAIHRGIPGATPGAYDRYIQTDAAINMGNSGGPMFDLNGNVIGINAALISPTGASVGIGLAIPAELAKPVIDALAKGQRPSRGYLGVGLQPLDEDLAPSLGLPKNSGEIVRSLVPDGPAARGGLQQGDVIVTVNGHAGDARGDGFLSDRQHPGRFASAASDHPRRQAPDGQRHGRRAADRGSAFEDRQRHGDHAGQRHGAPAPSRRSARSASLWRR